MPISTDHKEAMALGRKQSQIVNKYLTVIKDQKPRRGRQRTTESITKRLEKIDADLKEASPVAMLRLVAEQRNLREELRRLSEKAEVQELEDQFVEVAREFGERKGYRKQDWKDVGVPVEVLEKAGI